MFIRNDLTWKCKLYNKEIANYKQFYEQCLVTQTLKNSENSK